MWVKKSLLQEVNSPFNGQIKVVRQFGSVRIEVNGLLQSGGVLNQIWKKPLQKLKKEKLNPQKVLILGLGGGTCAQLISQFWPKAKMIGIEIDPAIIKIAQQYFDLNKLSNLKIKIIDAFKYKAKEKFDLIIVDLYKGDQFPLKAMSLNFLKSVKSWLTPKGKVIFNHLFYNQKKVEAKTFIFQLEKVFPDIKLQRVLSNLMIFCSLDR